MKNEPVAWMRESDKEVCSIKGKQELLDEEGTDWNFKIPLYTHPAKTLTDEEIDKLKAEYTKLPPKPWNGTPIASFDIYDFARAILKKASEK